jgi:hypothetical protein
MAQHKIKGDKTFFVDAVGARAVVRDGRVTFNLRLSDPEMKPQMDELKHQIQQDPAVGRALLVKAGILTKGGHLTRKFAGNR